MQTIHQALFGYSNGHHLIASSMTLSPKDLRILEPLTDLSGPGMREEFDGYLTGYYMENLSCMTLSKTWFAQEMPRPGSVWTHTLLIPKGTEAGVVERLLTDYGFLRPDTTSFNWMKTYTVPIQITDGNAPVEMTDDSPAWDILSMLLESTGGVAVFAGSCSIYNDALLELLSLLPLGFFSNVPFCTGAFSNRTVAKAPFLLQVVPVGSPKSAWRSGGAEVTFFTEDKILQNKSKYRGTEIKSALNLMDSCGIRDINRQSLKQILQAKRKAEHGGFTELEFATQSIFDTFGDVCDRLVQELVALYFAHTFAGTEPIDPSELAHLCSWDNPCPKWDRRIQSEMIEATVRRLFTEEPEIVPVVLNALLAEELNALGFRMLRSLANAMNEETFSRYAANNSDKLGVLVSFNRRLALNAVVWRQPYGVQCDVLKSVSQQYDNASSDTYFSELLLTVYENSTEKLADRIYHDYGNLAISTYFTWAETEEAPTGRDWKNVCKYAPVWSVKRLCKTSKSIVFMDVISVLDPYDSSLCTIGIDVWEMLYTRFCVSGDRSMKEAYAQFLLPIILMSKGRYPDELTEFTFKCVHQILAENRMDYCAWEQLSKLLPEVSSNHMWDRCKRLRKASKRKKYSIDFY